VDMSMLKSVYIGQLPLQLMVEQSALNMVLILDKRLKIRKRKKI